jgi:hypothetical protein
MSPTHKPQRPCAQPYDRLAAAEDRQGVKAAQTPLRATISGTALLRPGAGKVTWVQDPVDLRGVPAIGRGVAGAVRGTQPERALIAKQPR